jgi:copper oxidase (laccase) domain-containing protein
MEQQNNNIFNISDHAVVTVYNDLSNILNNIFLPKQIHSNKIVEIINGYENLDDCDALITKNRNFLLGVKTNERNTKDDLTLPSNRRNKTKDRLLTVISFK